MSQKSSSKESPVRASLSFAEQDNEEEREDSQILAESSAQLGGSSS